MESAEDATSRQNRMTSVLAYQEEIIMLNFDNKPLQIYLCLQINGGTFGIETCIFGIIYVSLSSKAIKSNTQNLCISPLSVKISRHYF